jgi:hypothetical protein
VEIADKISGVLIWVIIYLATPMLMERLAPIPVSLSPWERVGVGTNR